MSDKACKIWLAVVLAGLCAAGLWAAIYVPNRLVRYSYLEVLIFGQVLAVCIWRYRERVLPLVITVFLWAGTALPFSEVWTSLRWYVLGAAAAAGFAVFMREHRIQLRAMHLAALFCVFAALVSGQVSAYPHVARAKSLSLLLLFVYAGLGARLAVIGREQKFLGGLLAASEFLVYVGAVCYFVFHYAVFGNPNSFGAIFGVVVLPVLLWGILIGGSKYAQRRRTFAFLLGLALLLSSYSRSAIVAAAVSCVLLCLNLRRYRFLLKGTAAAVLLSVLVATSFPLREGESALSLYLYKGDARWGVMGSRIGVWDKAVTAIRQSPWFGTGFGTSTTEYEVTQTAEGYKSIGQATREHGSSYLAITEWGGLVGSVPFFTLILIVARDVARVGRWMRRTRSPFSTAVPVAAILLAGLVHAVFEDWMFAVGYYLCVFFWPMAFVLADVVPAEAPMLARSTVSLARPPWKFDTAAST